MSSSVTPSASPASTRSELALSARFTSAATSRIRRAQAAARSERRATRRRNVAGRDGHEELIAREDCGPFRKIEHAQRIATRRQPRAQALEALLDRVRPRRGRERPDRTWSVKSESGP